MGNDIKYPAERAQDIYFRTDNFKEVIELCNLAIGKETNKGLPFLIRGSAKLVLGDNKGAVDDFNSAIKLRCSIIIQEQSSIVRPKIFNPEKRPHAVVGKDYASYFSTTYSSYCFAQLGVAVAYYRLGDVEDAKTNLESTLEKTVNLFTFEDLAPEVKQMITKFNIPIVEYNTPPSWLMWLGALGGLFMWLFGKLSNRNNLKEVKGKIWIRRK